MDELENIVIGDIHEKCLHASGALIVWIGATDEYEVKIENEVICILFSIFCIFSE